MSRIAGDLKERTLRFGVEAMAVVDKFPHDPRGWVVAKQLARSATSIGANVWEADAALTSADFAHEISLARKESSETMYWLELSKRSELLPAEDCVALAADELLHILATIVRKTQAHIRRGDG